MAMLEDTMNDMNSNEGTALTDAELEEYADLNPFLIYVDGGKHTKGGKLSVAIVEGVRTTANKGSQIKLRKQGVRKGVRGYVAQAIIPTRKLVPVFALVEESLVDAMLISPAALALGMAALKVSSNPTNKDLVDALVEQYEESANINKQFFPPQPSGQSETPTTLPSVLTADWDGNTVPVYSPTFTGEFTMPDVATTLGTQPAVENKYDGNYVAPSGDVATSSWASVEVSVEPVVVPLTDVITAVEGEMAKDLLPIERVAVDLGSVCSPAVPTGCPTDDVVPVPGVEDDGQSLDFDPSNHVIP